MDSKTIVMCVVAFLLGMLMANMLKSVCGCKVVEGQEVSPCDSACETTKNNCLAPKLANEKKWDSFVLDTDTQPCWDAFYSCADVCDRGPDASPI